MEPTIISLPWREILKLALSAGIVTAIFNQGFISLRDWRKVSFSTKRDATYLALRLAVILEEFSIKCAEYIESSNMFNASDGHVGAPNSVLPPLKKYPEEIDWKTLDPVLAARALAIPNELLVSAGKIGVVYDIDEDYGAECISQTGICGFRALRLGEDLRRKYSLPPFDMSSTSWDIKPMLRMYHDKEMENVEQLREFNQ